MRFSRSKAGQKRNERKVSQKEKKDVKESQFGSQFDPLFATNDWDLKEILESYGFNLKPNESSSKSSRLAPTLKEIFAGPLALAYFMEFLEQKNSKHLADFWLAVQAFSVVAMERCRLNSSESARTKQLSSRIADNKNDQSQGTFSPKELHSRCIDKVSPQGALATNLKQPNLNSSHVQDDDTKGNIGQQCLVDGYPNHQLNGELNISQNSQKSKNTFRRSPRKEDLPSRVNFTGNWVPFSSSDPSLSKRVEVPLEKLGRQNSYVARRIMVKQTRNRTKSTVVDAVGLYARFISLDADEPLGLPSTIRNQIETEISRDKDSVSPDCFLDAQNYVTNALESFHVEFLRGPYGNKYKLYLLRETKPRLQDILYNETALFYFMEYLDRENCKEILEFWLMAESFEQNIHQKMVNETYDITEAVDDAMSIYEKYFSMRAKHQIIKDDKLRILIENNICREDGPQPNCFCIPVAFAWTVLKEIFFERFLVSDNYTKLIENICKNSVHRPQLDEPSSLTSSYSHSESTEFLPAAISMSDFLDKDADDLWYRPDAGRLAMGYVNPLGVFVTELDSPEFEDKSEKSSVSKLGRAMRNLLSKETEEEKERIALEKAQKIVEDIKRQANRR